MSHKVTVLPDDEVSKKSAIGWNATVSIRRWMLLFRVHSGFIVSDKPASGMLHSLIFKTQRVKHFILNTIDVWSLPRNHGNQ